MAKKKTPNFYSAKYLLPIVVVIGIIAVSLGLYGYGLLPRFARIGINQVSNASGETVLTFSPSSVSAKVGSESTLTLNANAGTLRLGVVRVELTYDQSKLGTPTVDLGTFLANPLSSPKIDNGKISFSVAAAPDSGGVTGSGVIATIKFKPTSTGSSNLIFTTRTAAYSLTADKVAIDADTLKSASDVTINVGSESNSNNTNNATPTPTPTPTPASQNTVSVITTTPKPTVKPRLSTPTPTPLNPQLNQTSTSVQPPTNYNPSDQSPDMGPDREQLSNTTASSPSFFKKVMLGWGIILQYLLSLFGIN